MKWEKSRSNRYWQKDLEIRKPEIHLSKEQNLSTKKKQQIIDNKMYLFDKNYDQSQFFSYDHNVLYQAIHSDDYQIYTQ